MWLAGVVQCGYPVFSQPVLSIFLFFPFVTPHTYIYPSELDGKRETTKPFVSLAATGFSVIKLAEQGFRFLASQKLGTGHRDPV